MTFRFDLLLASKEKPKEKTEALAEWLAKNYEDIQLLADFARESNDSTKATCIEAMEYVSKERPEVINEYCFDFVIESLQSDSPRVKWESAKVIGNSAHLFSGKLEKAIRLLLENTEHKGTVVRWSAAYALAQIVKLKTRNNNSLIPALQSTTSQEEKTSIRKIYQDALKKVQSI